MCIQNLFTKAPTKITSPFVLTSLLGTTLLLSSCTQTYPTTKTQPHPVPSPLAEATSDAIGYRHPPQALAANMKTANMPLLPAPQQLQEPNNERYQSTAENPVKQTTVDAVSTLSIDVDTGSYANVRRFLNDGVLPPTDAVRIEELINYFSYNFAQPNAQIPFSVNTEVAASPWNTHNHIVKVGIKAIERGVADMPPTNLVFLVDVSGSMSSKDKLDLAKASLKLLAKRLRPQDTVSLVVYAGRTAVELPATAGNDTATILAAIDKLTANGSTNGEAALKLAYNEAAKHYKKGGINRILLMTDGDFNVGMSDTNAIIDMVESNRARGISLSTLGFGTGNYNEHMMEQIADKGNGNYSYIDSLTEAQKVLGDELAATFNTVAKDVKLQLEFNPATVKEWRLIGYENRTLAKEDFNNDNVDAGEIGAGKSVIALYEITPIGQTGLVDDSRYQTTPTGATLNKTNELGFLKIRYKTPNEDTSKLLTYPIANKVNTNPSSDMRFAMAVAGFGQLLNHSKYTGSWQFADAKALAQQSLTKDKQGYRHGFIKLIDLAEALNPAKR